MEQFFSRGPRTRRRTQEIISRRSFLRNGGRAALGLAATAALGTTVTVGCNTDGTEAGSQFGQKIEVGTTVDFPANTVKEFRTGKFYLSNVPDVGLYALYWQCQHQGCKVPWNPDETFKQGGGKPDLHGVFHCTCHGAIYGRDGDNLAGPALSPLQTMKVTIEGTKITVDTANLKARNRVQPGDATSIPS